MAIAPGAADFGDQQLSALKDYIQAVLKLNYNDRVVG